MGVLPKCRGKTPVCNSFSFYIFVISFKHLSSCFCVFRLFVFYLHIGEVIVSINTNHEKWCHFFIRVGFLPQFTLIDSWVRYNVYHLSYFNVSNSFEILKIICEVMKEFSAIGQRLSNWG